MPPTMYRLMLLGSGTEIASANAALQKSAIAPSARPRIFVMSFMPTPNAVSDSSTQRSMTNPYAE